MSGISVSEDAVNLYYLIRARSTYRWALWRIDDSGTQVVVADVGEPGSSYTEFLGALPENDCRYGGESPEEGMVLVLLLPLRSKILSRTLMHLVMD